MGLLRSGGAYILIKDRKIEYGAPGDHSFKGAAFSFDGPATQNALGKVLPKSIPKMDERLVLLDHVSCEPLKNRKYRLVTEDGRTEEGVTDEQGRTDLISGESVLGVNFEILPDEA